MLNLMKGLPLTYNRDMQLDKPPLFDSVDTIKQMVELLSNMFSTLKVKKESASKAIKNDSFFTVDLMEYLIRKNVSYREAHDIVGKMVKECLDHDKKISDLSENDLKKYSKKFALDVKKIFYAQNSINAKKSLGSTNPILVKKQLATWKKKLNARI